MDRDFGNQTAPWDVDIVGTQFALLCHLENLPNENNVAHLCLMTIFPKYRPTSVKQFSDQTISRGAASSGVKETLDLQHARKTENTSSEEDSEQEADGYD
jgi:hypothetical protein